MCILQNGADAAAAAMPFYLAVTLIAQEALAHGGGLNAEGCHNNRNTGDYHCHRAPAVTAVSDTAPQLRTDLEMLHGFIFNGIYRPRPLPRAASPTAEVVARGHPVTSSVDAGRPD
jgi:hypothetical protein